MDFLNALVALLNFVVIPAASYGAQLAIGALGVTLIFSILMVEQNARQALEIADMGYVLVQGANRYTDTGAALLADPDVRRTFLGG